jgi:hypothetical protein
VEWAAICFKLIIVALQSVTAPEACGG